VQIHVITAFPNVFDGFKSASIFKRALEHGHVELYLHHIRDYATDKHKQIDDYPYGGGPGMILKPEPLFRCIADVYKKFELKNTTLTFMTPLGETFTQKKAVELSLRENLVLLCGHYKGVDQRVIKELVNEEISIGDFVLSGGEVPAMCIIDSVVRLLPGVIGDIDSAVKDSFQNELLDHPHYTRPETFRGMDVPKVLLSGNHENIEKWRHSKALDITKARRYDLYKKYLNDENNK